MWTRPALLLVIASVGACASAGHADEGGRPDGGGIHPTVDAATSDGATIDAPTTIDAPATADAPTQTAVTLSQTTSGTLVSNQSIACPGTDGVGTSQNSYYRVFDLTALGITTAFQVSSVGFQVEDCESVGGNGTTVSVSVGTYSGTPGTTLTPSKISLLQTATGVAVPEVAETTSGSPGGTVTAPISATIPAGSLLVVEVDAPDGTDTYQLYMGTSSAGEKGKGYISTQSQCTNPGTTPTSMASVAGTELDLLLTVTGTPQ